MQHAAWLKVGKLQRLSCATRRFKWQGRRAGRHFACQHERTDALKQVSPADSVHEFSKLNRSRMRALNTKSSIWFTQGCQSRQSNKSVLVWAQLFHGAPLVRNFKIEGDERLCSGKQW